MAKSKDILDNFLSDLEKTKIQLFIEDEVQAEAVRKVLLFSLYNNGVLKKGEKANPLVNFALGLVANRPDFTDEQLGRDLRASWNGINALEIGFSNLARYRKDDLEKVDVKNEAR